MPRSFPDTIKTTLFSRKLKKCGEKAFLNSILKAVLLYLNYLSMETHQPQV